MTGTSFASYIRKKTKTNTTTFTDAEIVEMANVVKDELAEEIVANVDESYFEIELTRDLEASIRNYTFPNDILKHVNHVEVDLDGDSDYTPLTEADKSQFDDIALLQNDEIKLKYSAEKPQFIIRGRELVILSGDDMEAVTDGLKMTAEIYPEDITTSDLGSPSDLSIPSSDTTFRLPRTTHFNWATKVIIMYKESQDVPIPLTKSEEAIEFRMERMFKKLTPRNKNRSFQASTPQNTGHDY